MWNRIVKNVTSDGIIIEQKMWTKRLTLSYEKDKCAKCGTCVDVCPFEALSMNTVGELSINEKKCVFCGICDPSCPFGALEFKIDGDHIILSVELDVYPRLLSTHKVNHNCLPCVLCKEVCPQEAIELKVEMKKKEEISPFKDSRKGDIKIDKDKCNFCGICKIFCDAFILVPKEAKGDDILPFKDILINKEKCDYCKICEEICPEGAIKVTSDEKVIEIPSIKGKIIVNEQNCLRCGRCEKVCPYNAIKIEKIFEGTLSADHKKCRRRLPTAEGNCTSCRDVCPVNAVYFLEPKKLFERIKNVYVQKDFCIYCGACIQLCPEEVFRVSREKVHHTEVKSKLWDRTLEKLSLVRKVTSTISP